MTVVFCILAVVLFLVAWSTLDLSRITRNAFEVARHAADAVGDPGNDDSQKERVARQAAISLLSTAFSICWRGAFAVALSFTSLALCDLAGIAPIAHTTKVLVSWQFVTATTVAVCIGFWCVRIASSEAETRYSALDKTIHRIAFSSRYAQIAAADIESLLFRDRFDGLKAQRPVFITSLPRAGTTLLLDVFTAIPGFASSTYRDMPFVCAPILWNAISEPFRRSADMIERAHGDGMLVSFDSPEAFEEVAWKTFWPKKYKIDRIELWSADECNGEFEEFISDYVRKVIAVRLGETVTGRYVSKNNNNISRLAYIKRIFPDCSLLVPFRSPINQAASMLKQHENFSERHDTDAFAEKYMGDIGHYEFGHLHRKFDFDGFNALTAASPDDLEYWIGYWISAFEAMLELPELVTFISYERACRNGAETIKRICEEFAIAETAEAADAAKLFRPAGEHDISVESTFKENLDRAMALHDRLLTLSIV